MTIILGLPRYQGFALSVVQCSAGHAGPEKRNRHVCNVFSSCWRNDEGLVKMWEYQLVYNYQHYLSTVYHIYIHIIDSQFANILTITCWCVPLIHSLSLNINMYKEASTCGHVV